MRIAASCPAPNSVIASKMLANPVVVLVSPGPTLVYLAEDALPQVRARIAGICSHRGIDLSALDVHVITAPAVRLDQSADQKRLSATLEQLRPKLLLLDPLVRLHRLDENSSADISSLLGYLRELQRRYDVAVVVTHL
jgi:RecA-family ATPase